MYKCKKNGFKKMIQFKKHVLYDYGMLYTNLKRKVLTLI